MDPFDISAISGVGNISALSEYTGGELGDLSYSNLSVSQAAELSMRLNTAERNYRHFRVESDRQLAHLKADVHDKDERASRLETQLAETSTRADALLQSFNEDVLRLNEQKRQLEGDRLKFMQLNADLAADLERKRNELANVKMQLTLAEEKAAKSTSHAEKQMSEYRTLYNKYNMAKRHLLEAAKMKNRIEALESDNDRLAQEGSAKMRLSNDLHQLSELERENTRLKNDLSVIRQYNENVDVLREKVSHLTSNLEAAKADASRLTSVEAENNFLKEKLRFLGISADGNIPSNAAQLESNGVLSARICQLEAAARADAGEIASLSESLSVHRDARNRLMEELEQSRLKIADLERLKENESDSLAQVKSQLALSSSERDAFRSLLSMVERHLGFTGSPLSSVVAANIRVPTQIKELEAAFEAHKAEVARIRNELLTTRRKAENYDADMSALKDELEKTKSELEAKTTELTQIQFEHSRYAQMLEASYGSKPYLDDDEAEANRGQILHYKMNPADVAFKDWLTDEAISLEQQRRALRNRNSADGLPQVPVDAITSAEIEDLRRRVDALERTVERKEKDLKATREMAAFSLKELHSAVTHLLGFELNLNAADKIYSLRSAYAEPTELFLFKPRHHQKTGSVSFQLLETEMARRFKESVQLYVVQHQSIPAFLASVTTDLFCKQTLIA